jgi:rhodanese-related sulfurtransferase
LLVAQAKLVLSIALLIETATAFAAAPEAISPEAAGKLQATQAPIVFVDADRNVTPPADASNLYVVYFSRSPSIQAANRAAENASRAGVENARWLTGTALDWQREKLRIDTSAGGEARAIDPNTLSAALKEGAQLQIVDVRSREQFDQGHISSARHKMPHELAATPDDLSKARWTILIDDGSRVAETLARDLHRKGYVLSGWLDGGYPAWMAEPNK